MTTDGDQHHNLVLPLQHYRIHHLTIALNALSLVSLMFPWQPSVIIIYHSPLR